MLNNIIKQKLDEFEKEFGERVIWGDLYEWLKQSFENIAKRGKEQGMSDSKDIANKIKSIYEDKNGLKEQIMELLDGMGMKLPPKNEDDRPYVEGFNDAVKHIKEQIEHL